MNQVAARSGIGPQETAFVGDDLFDLSIFGTVSIAIAVVDAHACVLEKADIITAAKGGAGAVREYKSQKIELNT